MAIQLDLTVDRSLAVKEPIVFMDEDFTGATFEMQVRATPDASGTPYIDLETVTDTSQGIRLLYAGTATISAHITAGRLQSDMLNQINPATGARYALSDSVTLSEIQIYIGQATLRPPGTGLIPLPQELGDTQTLAYDLIITRSGDIARKEFYGAFIINGTVSV